MNATLKFFKLRLANMRRLPLFKNKLGAIAHSRADGSDWSPAQWFQAAVGEMGETARVRLDYEAGIIERDEYVRLITKEVPDVQIYWDLFAARALDVTRSVGLSRGVLVPSHATMLMGVMAFIGEYANARKKLDRGDTPVDEFLTIRTDKLNMAITLLTRLAETDPMVNHTDVVTEAHPFGIDLGQATVDKLNEVSDRVGCEVKL